MKRVFDFKKSELLDEKWLKIPVYANSAREMEILSVHVPVEEKNKEKWIQTGLCFYLEN